MTRARYIALTVLIGACWMGHSRVYAQGKPDFSGYAVAPAEAFTPGEGPYPAGGAYPPGGAFPEAIGPPGYDPQAGGYPAGPYGGPPPAETPWYGAYQEVDAAAVPAGKLRVLDGGYFRVDYLNWNISKPGKVLLGAPVLQDPDPTRLQNFFDNTGVLQATGFVPDLGQVNFKNLNGVRGTLGADLFYGGTLEASAFILNRGTSSLAYDHLLNTGVEILTSTFKHGELSNQNNLFAYNSYFHAGNSSGIWGAEGNYLWDLDREGLLHFRPLIGARYLSVHETLSQEGRFISQTIIEPDTISTIDANSYNQMYGGQIGFRSEIVTKYLVLGVEPKYALLGNSGTTQVTTNHFRSNLDPTVTTQENFTTFSSVFDLATYARLNVTSNFSLRFGYNVMLITRVSRAANDIYYNDNGPTNPPAIVARKSFNDILVNGITVGAEFRY